MRISKVIFAILLINIFTVEANPSVTDLIPAWMEKNQIPGVAVQVYDHGKVHAYYFGVVDRATQKPVNQNTIFEVGSFTKLFTSLLLAQQVNQGHMALNNSISEYLPDLTQNSDVKKITLENLATHTGGLAFSPATPLASRVQLADYFAHWKPAAPIGTQWGYSNMSIGLLGYSLEAATHRNMNQLYRDDILLPLKMKPIGLTVPKKWLADYAQGYDQNNKAVPPTALDLFPSAGSMKMSAYDSQLFLKAALGLSSNKKLTQAMQLTQTPFVNVGNWQQGLGWVINCHPLENKTSLLNPSEKMDRGPFAAQQLPTHQQQYDASCLIDKTGGTNGFVSYIVLIPEQKTGVVILTNRFFPSGEIIKMGRQILFNLLAK